MSVVKYTAASLLKNGDNAPVKTLLNAANHSRCFFAAAFHDQSDSIFIVGGDVNGYCETSASVTRFSLEDNKFHPVPDMSQVRKMHSAVVAGEALYAFGG